MMKINKYIQHLKTILKHKAIVFSLMRKCGYGWQGFFHDSSKFSPTEFLSSARYFQGNRSPIEREKEVLGYSKAWLHHKGRNKHHPEYWTDYSLPEKAIIMPYKYAAEMVCDKLAAGIVYNGKNWTKDTQINYYMKEREKILVHPKIDKFLIEIFTQVSKDGLDKTLTKENIKETYKKYCN